MLPISGKLSERYGRRRVFLGSVVAFTVASLCCGLADNIYVLIALRALQAAGGAGFTPSATGIVVDYFGDSRDRAVSLFGSIFPIGAMIGPIFGGLFVSYWTWRGIFFVNVPIGLAVIVLALRYIPRDRPRAKQREPEWTPPAWRCSVRRARRDVRCQLPGRRNATYGPVVRGAVGHRDHHLVAFFRHINRSAQPFIAPPLITGRASARSTWSTRYTAA